MVAYDPLGDPPHQLGVALRVDTFAADLVADTPVERLDQLRVRIGHRHGSPVPSEVLGNLGVFTRRFERHPQSVEDACDVVRPV